MRVLVTGNLGYVGSVLAPALWDAGHEVRGLDAGLFTDCLLCPPRDSLTERVDLRDVEARHLEGAEAVVHLAALSNDPLGSFDPGLTRDVNLFGTIRLLCAAKRAGVRRFLFASTCGVYGSSALDRPLAEDDAVNPLTPYAATKYQAERECESSAGPDLGVTVLRLATVYGPSPRQRVDTVLNDLAARAVETGQVTLLSDGSAWRPLVHVADVADAVVRLLGLPPPPGFRLLNLGPPRPGRRVADLAGLVSRETGCVVARASDAAPDNRSYRVDFSRVQQALGLFPWRGIREGLGDLLRAYEAGEGGLLGPKYNRLAWLKGLIGSGKLREDLRWK